MTFKRDAALVEILASILMTEQRLSLAAPRAGTKAKEKGKQSQVLQSRLARPVGENKFAPFGLLVTASGATGAKLGTITTQHHVIGETTGCRPVRGKAAAGQAAQGAPRSPGSPRSHRGEPNARLAQWRDISKRRRTHSSE